MAIFGKHPAWPDHIALPLQSAALGELRGRLYEGISAAIARGAWSDPAAGSAFLPFAHSFCAAGLAGERGWIIGRIWESTDAIGRGHYPMVAAVHLFGLSARAAWEIAADSLLMLENQCRAAATQAQVLAAMDDAVQATAAAASTHWRAFKSTEPGDALPPRLGRRPHAADPAIAAAVSWDWFLQSLRLGRRNLARWRSRHHRRRIKGVRLRLRGESASAALCRWAEKAHRRLDGTAPVFASAATAQPWIDLAVGDLTPMTVQRMRTPLRQQ